MKELQVNIAEEIRQLSLSPNGHLLAVVTSHTVHVVVLPHPSKLGQQDNKPLRPLTRTVAPTAHVLAQSPVASILWHPVGVGGNCLVTITADAVVRLWELDFKDHMSFDTPSLAVDLKKLAVGASRHDDFRPNKLNANRSFSLDSVGMDVASACFGGHGSSEESPWCAMTLWVAMKEGDVYALCPLLPSKWQPSSTMIPSLSVQIVSTLAATQEVSLPLEEVQQSKDQYQWITDLDGQQPRPAHGTGEILPGTEVYCRPLSPSPIPKLQGPFQVFGDEYDQDPEISDIHVVAATVDTEELMDCGDSDADSGLGLEDDAGLAASIVCLMTKTGRIYVCLDLDGVQAQWLPTRRDLSLPAPDEPSLVILEMVDTMKIEHVQKTEWPTFSLDVDSRYSFFVTHSQAVYYLSMEPWTQSLHSELQSSANVGTGFRIDIITNGPGTFRERVLDFQQDHKPTVQKATAAVIFQDSDLGYFLLTAFDGVAQSVLLDKPDTAVEEELTAQTTYDLPRARTASIIGTGPGRQSYVPPSSLWERSTLPQFFGNHVQNRHKRALKEEIRLSSATLDLMTQAHRVLSEETYTLGTAAADLFRRCERLQDELRDQIERVKEVSKRTEEVIGVGMGEASSNDTPNAAVERRLKEARERHEKLAARFEALSKKVRKNNRKPLSDKERAFMTETDKINRSVSAPDEKQENGEEQHSPEIWHRYDEVGQLLLLLLGFD